MIGNHEAIKQWNKWLVLEQVRRSAPISRVDVARNTGLHAATVSKLVAELAAADLLKEVGSGESSGGRPPVMLELNPTGMYASGFHLTVGQVRLVITDLAANVVAHREMPLAPGAPPRQVMDQMAQWGIDLAREAGVPLLKLAGAGVTVSGMVDQRRGCVVTAVNLPEWEDVPLVAEFGSRLGLPVYLVRDADAGAVAETWHGAGAQHGDMVFLYADMTVGAGIIVNGEILRGGDGFTGELGHTYMGVDGPACNCGQVGCLEAVASGMALLRDFPGPRSGGEDSEADRSSVLAVLNDPQAWPRVKETGRLLGLAVSNLINLFNPKVVVLGGLLMENRELFHEVERVSRSRALARLTEHLPIVPTRYGLHAPAVGAGTLALSRRLGHVRMLGVASD